MSGLFRGESVKGLAMRPKSVNRLTIWARAGNRTWPNRAGGPPTIKLWMGIRHLSPVELHS